MKPVITKQSLEALGLTEYNGVFYPRNHKALATIKKLASQTDVRKSKSLRKPKKPKESKIDLFVVLVERELNLKVIPEFKFHPERKWRFDYCIKSLMLAIEVEGGIHSGGRHVRGVGYENDMEKYNHANALGWRLFRVTPSKLMTTETLEMIKAYQVNTELNESK